MVLLLFFIRVCFSFHWFMLFIIFFLLFRALIFLTFLLFKHICIQSQTFWVYVWCLCPSWFSVFLLIHAVGATYFHLNTALAETRRFWYVVFLLWVKVFLNSFVVLFFQNILPLLSWDVLDFIVPMGYLEMCFLTFKFV